MTLGTIKLTTEYEIEEQRQNHLERVREMLRQHYCKSCLSPGDAAQIVSSIEDLISAHLGRWHP